MGTVWDWWVDLASSGFAGLVVALALLAAVPVALFWAIATVVALVEMWRDARAGLSPDEVRSRLEERRQRLEAARKERANPSAD